MIRRDIIVENNYQYFYTQIGKKEIGNININFDYNGEMFKEEWLKKILDESSGWMNRYILSNEYNNK